MKRLQAALGLVMGGLLASTSVQADLMVREAITLASAGSEQSGETTSYFQGDRMRQEIRMAGQTAISIIDLQQGRLIQLDPERRHAVIMELAPETTIESPQPRQKESSIALQPTDQHHEIGGHRCREYKISMTFQMETAQHKGVDVEVGGPVCIAEQVQGITDRTSFYRKMYESGMFLGVPGGKSVQRQPGRVPSQVDIYDAMAKQGFMLESSLTTQLVNAPPEVVSAVGMHGSRTESRVLAWSTDALDGSLFEVPEGWSSETP